MARQVIASLEEQCARATARAAAYRDELEQERKTIVGLRRRVAQLTEGLRTRTPNPGWAAQAAIEHATPAHLCGQRPTVRLAAVS